MYVNWQTIITAGGVLSALGLIIGCVLKVHKWCLKQEHQSEEIHQIKEEIKQIKSDYKGKIDKLRDEYKAEIDKLKRHHENDIHDTRKEGEVICYALSACLDGLSQLGCNHTVPGAKEKLDEYLNQQAHG